MKQISSKVSLNIQTDIDDKNFSKETLKYLLEQDLQDIGWEISEIKIKEFEKGEI